jgi:hypothetical protein
MTRFITQRFWRRSLASAVALPRLCARHRGSKRRSSSPVAVLTVAVATIATVLATAGSASAGTSGDQTADGHPAVAEIGPVETVAWAGTDFPNHHLNIADAQSALCKVGNQGCWPPSINKFSDTVMERTGPALGVATVPGVAGQQGIVAWPGTDNPTHIYVGWYNGTNALGCHTRLPESTFAAPYLVGDGTSHNLYLVWSGTDLHINIARLSTSNCTVIGGQITESNKVTLTDTAANGASATIFHGNIFLAWPGIDPLDHIYTGQFVGTSQLAHHTCLCQYASFSIVGLDNPGTGVVKMAYTGTDERIYVATSTDGTTYPTQKVFLQDTSFDGPDIDNVGSGATHVFYTGTDTHINGEFG